MADRKAGKSAPAARTKGGMSLAQNALVFVVAAVIAAGFGGLQVFLTPASDTPLVAAKPSTKNEKAGEGGLVEMGAIDLPPVVTNLASPPDIWIRVEGAILFEGKTLPHGEALAGQIAGDILAFMRTQSLAQIQGAAGLQHLRQDLAERVATRSEGRVREFIIKSLVVQ